MPNQPYPALFQPGQIGALKIKNRYVTAPMTRGSAGLRGVPNHLMANHYRQFAKGGFGLVITEGTYIDEKSSQGYLDQPGIANDDHIAGWRSVVDGVHEDGGIIFQQLLHLGALVQHNIYTDETIAPSAIQPQGQQLPHYRGEGPYGVPRAMSLGEIAETVAAFGLAAERSVAAGFDGVEIHGANGYICDQFLTDYTNHRDDEFGGSLENRLRFPCKVLAAVKDAVGARVPVGIRISQTKVNDFEHSWAGGVDDARLVFGTLAELEPDYIHISTHKGLEPVFDCGRHLADLAKEFSGVTVIACGALQDPERAQGVIENGQADFVALAKGALADPALPDKISAGEAPVPFDPAMITPVATLQNTLDWRAGVQPAT